MVGGLISSGDYKELLVTTFSGKIFGLTTKPPGMLEASLEGEIGIAKLKLEIQQLEEELKKEFTGSNFIGESLTPLILSVNHQ